VQDLLKRGFVRTPTLVQDYTNSYLSRSAFVQLANAEAVLKLRTRVSSKNALGCVQFL